MSGAEKEGSGGEAPLSSGQPPSLLPTGPKFKAYKLLLDPCLIKGATKLYRFDGVVPDDPTYPPVVCRDPRTSLSLSRMWNRQDGLDLPIPRFKIDSNYIGKPPPLEVSITNLNDNVDKAFLSDLLQKFGRAEEVLIYYHPTTNRHMGIARIVFESITASKACVAKLHNSPLMGNILNVFLDPFGEKIKELVNEMLQEKKVLEPLPPSPFKKVEEKKGGDGEGKDKQPEANARYSKQKPPPPPGPPHTPPQHAIQTPIQNTMQTPTNIPLYPPVLISTPSSTTSSNTTIQYPIVIQTPIKSLTPIKSVDPTPEKSNPNPQWPVPPPAPRLGRLETPPVATEVELVRHEEVLNLNQGTITNHHQNHVVSLKDNECKMEEEEEEGSPKMDLDTRIKLLLKSSKSTPFGKFLNCNLSDSEDEDEGDGRGKFRCGFTIRKRKSLCISRSEIWRESENSDVDCSPRRKSGRRSRDRSQSPPPSPFLDQRKRVGDWKPINGINQEFRLSDLDQVSDDSEIELPMDAEGEKEDDAFCIQLPPGPPPMPVSEDNFIPPAALSYASSIAPFYPQNSSFVQQMAPYGVYPATFPVYPSPDLSQWGLGPQPQFHHPQQIGYSQSDSIYSVHSQVPYYEQHEQTFNHLHPAPPPPPQEAPLSPASELRASTDTIVTSVFGRLTTDLRSILRRDCEKRLIEATSYKTFEDWFDAQAKQYKEAKENRDRENKRIAEEQMNGKVEMTVTEEALIGLGFRSIPKLPSFKIQKKVITPVVPVEDESSRKSLLEESEEQNDDSEQDIPLKRRPVRGLTSESELDSSDDADSDDSFARIPKRFNKHKEEEEAEAEKPPDDLWAESISEGESLSPKPSPPLVNVIKTRVEEVNEEDAESIERREREMDELLERKIAAFQRALMSPLRPTSPERVSIEGPYVHTYDHNYALGWEKEPRPPTPPPILLSSPEPKKMLAVKIVLKPKVARTPKPRQPPAKAKKTAVCYRPRDEDEERKILTEFLSSGVDMEDIVYFRKCFEDMLKEPSQAWVTRTHWVDHPPTKVLERKKKAKRRVHVSGAARTEGFYKLDADEKRRHKLQWAKVTSVEYSAPGTVGAVGVTALAQEKHQGKTQIEKSREARSQQRRILTALGNEVTSTSDLLKFNQLKFRKKNLCFRRSTIHDWGLFAAEPIAADEMVIEYVGQTIRPYLADVREQKYEKQGIGSSYLFRIDLENIIDATKCGNLSRFINHSCNPNCYAKVITIQGEKKIVIYSKEAIPVNDEITYDYKFPIEEKKIICLCGTPQCRGTLN